MNTKQLRRAAARIPKHLERKDGPPAGETPEQKITREIQEAKIALIAAVRDKVDKSVVDQMQQQLDALDKKMCERTVSGQEGETLRSFLEKHDGAQRLMTDKKGTAFIEIPMSMLEQKSTITNAVVGSQTTGVLQIDRTPGIVPEARQQLTIRDVLPSRPTSLALVDFVKVNSGPSPASMQTEAQDKVENAVTFTSASERVQTIATTLPFSTQCLQDFSELEGYIRNALPYYVSLREEAELLHGGGAGNDLHGLVVQATAFNTALLGTSWTRVDMIARGIEQLQIAKEITPSWICLNPVDAWAVRLTKDSQGRYLSNSMDVFWGLTPIITTSMGSGNWLIGNSNPAASEIRDRTTMQLELSTSHSDFFIKNLVMARCERRLALCTYRPASFLFGTFNSSPA